MSKLDVFLWLTVKCYSEALQKYIDKFKECQTNGSTKKIHLRTKKGKHRTERNNLKYQLL